MFDAGKYVYEPRLTSVPLGCRLDERGPSHRSLVWQSPKYGLGEQVGLLVHGRGGDLHYQVLLVHWVYHWTSYCSESQRWQEYELQEMLWYCKLQATVCKGVERNVRVEF